jgi:hypothetical protein
MTTHEKKIDKWQLKAAALRTAAKGMRRGTHRHTMIEVAEAYRRMVAKAIKESGKLAAE